MQWPIYVSGRINCPNIEMYSKLNMLSRKSPKFLFDFNFLSTLKTGRTHVGPTRKCLVTYLFDCDM